MLLSQELVVESAGYKSGRLGDSLQLPAAGVELCTHSGQAGSQRCKWTASSALAASIIFVNRSGDQGGGYSAQHAGLSKYDQGPGSAADDNQLL